MSSDDERPPKQLLQPLTHFEPPKSNAPTTSIANQESSTTKKPYPITFSTRDDETLYTQKLMESCATYSDDPAQPVTWLKETGAFITKEGYPETDHPFIIRHLLIDDALGYYLVHEDIGYTTFPCVPFPRTNIPRMTLSRYDINALTH